MVALMIVSLVGVLILAALLMDSAREAAEGARVRAMESVLCAGRTCDIEEGLAEN